MKQAVPGRCFVTLKSSFVTLNRTFSFPTRMVTYYSLLLNQVFNENPVIVMLKSAVGGRAGVNFWFPLDSFSLLQLIDTKLGV